MSAGRLTHTAGVVVPLRSFALGKVRLAHALDDHARRELSRTMAERVVGLERLVVMHADLPLATSLDGIADDAGAPIAVLVPDHHHDGNPVLAIPAAVDFSFAYGPDSCARHAAEARRLGLEVRIVEDRALGFDVDDESDLEALAHEPRPTQ